MHHLIRASAGLLATTSLLSACADGVQSPLRPDLNPSFSTSSNVGYWNGNFLEFSDATGTFWRLERTGADDTYTEFRIIKNGALVGYIRPTYDSQGSMTGERRLNTTGDWYEADTNGNIESTYYKPPMPRLESEPGGQPLATEASGIAACSPSALASQTGGATIQSGDPQENDCGAEREAMEDAAWEAAIAGGVAAGLLAVPFTEPVDIGAIAIFADRSVSAIAKLSAWARCKVM